MRSPIILILSFLLFSCDEDPITIDDGGIEVETVSASFKGIIVDTSGDPITSVLVEIGNEEIYTGTDGLFEISDVSVLATNAVVKASRSLEFDAFRTVQPIEGHEHYIRIEMMRRGSSRTVNAATGGAVTFGSDFDIIFPPNAIETAEGVAYEGDVRIYSK
ncbi:MAG: hypothetical protein GY751_12790 [Bacteroidetes bacterium]|nr:hypothetical protein [Bacteroidota bacterium]